MSKTGLSVVTALIKPPSGLAKRLREIADDVDKGVTTSFVCARVENDCYEFMHAASLNDCLVMAALLYQNCVDRMRA